MTMQDKIKLAQRFFQDDEHVAFAYAFGSAVKGTTGPLSDIDLAVFLTGVRDQFAYRLMLMEKLSRSFKSDALDLVILNEAPLLLRYQVIRGGELLKDEPSQRVGFETATLREFLDTLYLRAVQCRAAKGQLAKGGYFG